MVRFNSQKSVPNYMGRREQRRMLTLVALLGLVFFLMREASQPRNWNWFELLSGGGPAAADKQGELTAVNLDTRLNPMSLPEAQPGEIIAPLPKELKPGAGPYFPGVNPEFLKDVRDDTVFRGAENEAFFNLLGVLKNSGDEELVKASQGPIAFVQLFQQPEEHRGELITLRGTLRAAYPTGAAKNDLGLQQFYQTWLQPYDNKHMLVVVYTLYLPKNFPTGDRLAEEVELTGFAYKRWAYRAQDDIRTAPLVLARNLKWIQPVVAQKEPIRILEIVGVLAGAALFAGLVISTMFSKSKPLPARSGFQLPSRSSAHPETPPTGEELQRMLEAREAELTATPEDRSP